MKSASYYSRQAAACRELGRRAAADEWAVSARKARAAKKANAKAAALLARLRYHVTGAIERGEAVAIVGVTAKAEEAK